jgi:hypothetical protein
MKLNSFKGIHNTATRQDLPRGACADAVDVDITGKGEAYERSAVLVRNGYALSKSAPIAASYTSKDGVAYCVSGGWLNRIAEDLSFIPIAQSTAKEFCDDKGVLFTDDKLMAIGDTAVNLQVPQPKYAPQVVLSSGSRAPGFYTCAYTYTNSDGLEGGMSPIIQVELKSEGEVLVTPVDLPGYVSTIYLAPEDGSVFLDNRNVPIPPACIGTAEIPENVAAVEVLDGKLFTVELYEEYSVIRFSQPFHFHLFNYEKDFVVIPDQVYAIRASGGKLVIGAAKGIYAYSDEGLLKLANYGVVPGRSMARKADDTLLIHTVRGICAAFPFTELTESMVSLPMGQKCSANIVYQNGITKFVGLHDGGGVAFNAEF